MEEGTYELGILNYNKIEKRVWFIQALVKDRLESWVSKTAIHILPFYQREIWYQ